LDRLSEVVAMLKQFSGFAYFGELVTMVSKLEDKIHVHKKKEKSYLHLEKNDLLKGLNWIEMLHKALIKKVSLMIEYQSFKAKKSTSLIFYPYLLKEYRNRWFLLGMVKKNKQIQVWALDRMIDVQYLTNEPFQEVEGFDAEHFFDDVIGVSKTKDQKPICVILEIIKPEASYIQTKPIHPSQTVLKETETSLIFSITVIWNFELEREILSFGEAMKVRGPNHLVRKMKSRMRRMLALYETEEAEDKNPPAPHSSE
ncbi:MAG: helix-turn-helix transcriptional regulator, partial [Bacteroidia bacterium]